MKRARSSNIRKTKKRKLTIKRQVFNAWERKDYVALEELASSNNLKLDQCFQTEEMKNNPIYMYAMLRHQESFDQFHRKRKIANLGITDLSSILMANDYATYGYDSMGYNIPYILPYSPDDFTQNLAILFHDLAKKGIKKTVDILVHDLRTDFNMKRQLVLACPFFANVILAYGNVLDIRNWEDQTWMRLFEAIFRHYIDLPPPLVNIVINLIC